MNRTIVALGLLAVLLSTVNANATLTDLANALVYDTPEPGTWLLMGVGILGLRLVARRRGKG